MASSNESTLLETIRNIIVTYKGTVGEPISLADISKIARVEPITLVSSNLNGIKELYNILHGILNIYAAYYLQAIGILSAQLVDVRILKILDKTNPDRDLKTLLTSGYTAYENFKENRENIKTLSLENCKYKLPLLNTDKINKISLESIYDESEDSTLTSSINRLHAFERVATAVGKVIEVKFTVRKDNGRRNDEISIPVVVRLDTMIIPADVVDSILISNTNEITLGNRFKDAISGRINFIKDFILASDLIKAHKKTLMKDPTGYYSLMLKRINNSRLYSALSGNISLAAISSIIIISEEDEQEVQKAIGGKLTNQKTKEIIFNNTSAMMIVVIDKEWERVSIHIKDIDGFSQNTYDDFKQMSNSSNNNITDILKAFSLGNPVSF